MKEIVIYINLFSSHISQTFYIVVYIKWDLFQNYNKAYYIDDIEISLTMDYVCTIYNETEQKYIFENYYETMSSVYMCVING